MIHINNNTRPNSRDKVVDSQRGNFFVGATVSSEAATSRDILKFALTLSTGSDLTTRTGAKDRLVSSYYSDPPTYLFQASTSLLPPPFV